MNQNELDRRIATVTGESVATIESLGFSLLSSPPHFLDRRPYYLPRKAGGKGRQRPRKRASHVKPLRSKIVKLIPRKAAG